MLMKFVVINRGLVVMLKSEMASWFTQGDKSYIALVCKEGHSPARDLTEREILKRPTDTYTEKNIIFFRMHIIIIIQSIHKDNNIL